MEENGVLTETEEKNGDLFKEEGGKTEAAPDDQVTISVKFNKEIKNLTADEAATLAQKGMKFEMIEDDFCKLRDLANKQKMSVPEYIESLEKRETKVRREELLAECGGNEKLADRVLELENGEKADDGLDELREYFPTVKSLDDLPRAVVESARLKGENLLNSYLRYRIVRKRRIEKENLAEQNAAQSSIGSQKSAAAGGDDAFLKALWGR